MSLIAADAVLYIASRSDIAGGEKYLLSVIKHLDRRRFEPVVVLPGDGPFRAALADLGVEHVVLPANYGWLQPPQEWYPFLSRVPERVRALARLIQDRGVRIVHTNSNQILDGALAARLCGVPHVYVAHIEFQSNLPIFERVPITAASFGELMAELSSHIIAVSQGVASSLQPAVKAERIQVIHNGLELAAYDRAVAERGDSFRRELGLAPGELLVTAVGRIHADKGFDVLIDAAARADLGIGARFVIIGGSDSKPYLLQLQQQIATLGLTDRVHLLPFRSDIPKVLAETDLFVLSSRREGHAFVLLEAMACGCPVVATLCAGVEETVVEGETGRKVPVGDASALAAAISEVVGDGDMRRRCGEAGFQRVRNEFSAEKMVAELQAAYERVLAGEPPRPGSIATDMFLQACSELGHLGIELTALRERVKRMEHLAAKLLDNPASKLLRRLRAAVRK